MRIAINDIPAVLTDGHGVCVKTVSVYIEDEYIVGVDQKPEGFVADRVISGHGKKLLIPGLINTHTHSYMSLFRNCADDLPFHQWLFDRILPLEDQLTGEDAYWGALLSCAEMIRTGTTCFSDMHMFKHHMVDAVQQSGMRAVLARGLVGSCQNGTPDDGGRLRDALEDITYAKQFDGGRITFFLAPHAIYTCDPGYLRHVADTAKEHGLGIHIHVSESSREVEDCIRQHNGSPVALLQSAGVFDVHAVAAHCVHVSAEDIAVLAKNNVHVATNPISNMKLGNGFAPVPQLLAAGVNVSLGTDSAASNNALNLFRELSALTLIHKGVTKDSTAVSAREGFLMATANGAKALLLEKSVGAVAAGKKADLVILDLDTPNFMPPGDRIAGLAYSATGMEPQTVLINGQIVMENREIKTMDIERVYYEIDRIAKRLSLSELV